MTKHSNSLDQRTFEKLSRLYIIALSTIAISVIVSQFLIRKHLKNQQSDSRVINIAGRQRMLSQKLTKETLLLFSEKDASKKQEITQQLKKTLSLWKSSHIALQKGNDSLGLPGNNSAIVSKQFTEINPIFDVINSATNSIITHVEETKISTGKSYNSYIDIIKVNESSFLTKMDAIVNQYDIEANAKINWLRRLELLLMVITLIILLGEFLFIFWPTAKSIRTTLAELLSAEKLAKKMAFDADELSLAKEKSVKELKALSRAMDETLLSARILPDGSIIHIGNRLSRLFKYSQFNEEYFWNMLSPVKNERNSIEELILKHKKTGWQGEVKASTKDNEDIWLEMAIIPYNPTNEKSELLIIASNITEKKTAQLEIDYLKQVGFEEKMNQQKIISKKIIENQEKEQSRIAKDVHDGIGQMLTGLKFNLESVNPENIEKTKEKIHQLKSQTSDIIKGVRTATFNLMPSELSDHGLVPALTKLSKELSRLTDKNIIFFNKTNFDFRLDTLTEINIYRITQEAINNAIKYANSSHILLSISHSESILSIAIDDNGKGFDANKPMSKDGGMGLTFMKERIKYINGRLFINSEEDKGTRVTLNIPLHQS
ncbi:sensor histidine kinase [Tenacibaculum jejuense]|uniref:Oxygen sensor histidine kinase NreB n=1 Tax=Tenacibaculum jejuense TaxID=584609 RepID=A0A238UAP9_9FLAO|nr:type IV pili methyl-accepting chemotaxis transducer N-terminal domain-containing protein [Tenacibaculum jejuense]SNR16277.1 Two-component system sensor histidine kinase [Tenacibaculum jejuense]